MIIIRLLIFTALFAILFACQKPYLQKLTINPDKDVITAHHSFSRNGYQNFVLHDSLRILDSDDLKGLPYLSFLQYSGELIFTTRNGYLYFVDLNDISLIRKKQFRNGIESTPTISNSM